MIDNEGNQISQDDLMKNMTTVPAWNELKRLLSDCGVELSCAYILDDQLVVCSRSGRGVCDFYFDGFQHDRKHGKIRYSPAPFGVTGWFNSPEEAEQLINKLSNENSVYSVLTRFDFSGLYRVFEKTDPNLPNGSFSFSSESYPSAKCEPIIKYLEDYYKANRVYGEGFRSDDAVIVITEDLCYSKDHFGPAKYDLHVFNFRDGVFQKMLLHSVQGVITGDSYNHFFVDGITDFSEDAQLGVVLRSCVQSGYKCSDDYYGYATINLDMDKPIRMANNPLFIFSRRTSERAESGPVCFAVTDVRYGDCNYKYVATDPDGVSKPVAVGISKTGQCCAPPPHPFAVKQNN